MADSTRTSKTILTAEDRTGGAFRSATANVRALDERIIGMGRNLAAGFGIGAAGATTALAGLAKQSIDFLAKLDDMSDQTSLSVGELDRLAQAAKIGGHDLDQVGAAAVKLAKNLSEAAGGNKDLAEVFRALGIRDVRAALDDLDGSLRTVGTSLATAENQTLAVAYAQRALGRDGASLLPFFKDMAERGDLVARVTGEQAAAADRLSKQWGELGRASESLGIGIANTLIPHLNRSLDLLTRILNLKPGDLTRLGGARGLIGGLLGAAAVADPEKALAKEEEALRKLQERRDTFKPERGRSGLLGFGDPAAQRKALDEQIADARKRRDILQSIVSGEGASKPESPFFEFGGGGIQPRLPDLPDEGEKNKAESEAKRRAAEAQRAREAFARERERMLELDRQGWVAHAEFLVNESDAYYTDLARQHEEHNRSEEALRQIDLAGLIAGIEAEKEEYESGLTAIAGMRKSALEESEAAAKRTADAGDRLGFTFVSAFEDAILEGRKFSDVLKAIEKDIARVILRKSITEPLGTALSEGVKSINWGSLVSGFFGGGRAHGGPVSPYQSYVVGERGPELLTMGTSAGFVTPNHQLQGGGGMHVEQHFHIASGVTRAELAALIPVIEARTKASIVSDKVHGRLSRTF